MAVNRFWIIYALFVCIACLISVDGIAQQANPFDVILTKSSAQPSNIQSKITDQDVLYRDEEALSTDSLQREVIQDTSTSSGFINQKVQEVDASNPFNVKKTDGLGIIANETKSKKKKTASNTLNKTAVNTSPRSTNNWFPELNPRKGGSTDIDYSLNFIFWILIASLLILAVVINLKRKSFLNLYRAITNDNYLKLLQREEQSGASFFFLLLYFLFFLNAALFIYQVLIGRFDIKGYKIFLMLFGGLVLIYLIRYIAVWLMQVTFPLEKEAKQYNFTIIMFNIIVGLLLIPVNILSAYAPFGKSMIYLGLGIIALFYLLRQIRGLFIAARTKGLSYFHFFIYLCSFEVAPLIWILSFIKF